MKEFIGFNKISRYYRDIVITEKIDGTNAQVCINQLNDKQVNEYKKKGLVVVKDGRFHYGILAGSRTRWINPVNDNYGFAKWVESNAEDLLTLGIGSHFGEWWGHGIQRKYNMDKKEFSLFNVSRWDENSIKPSCCKVVPILYCGVMNEESIKYSLADLKRYGSKVSEGFMNPEGIVIYHTHSGNMFKITIENDQFHKGEIK